MALIKRLRPTAATAPLESVPDVSDTPLTAPSPTVTNQQPVVTSNTDQMISAARARLLESGSEKPVHLQRALQHISLLHLGFELPQDWTGYTQVRGCIRGDEGITEALGDQVPEFYGVYAGLESGRLEWLIDIPTNEAAKELEIRLTSIDALSRQFGPDTVVVAPEPDPTSKVPSADTVDPLGETSSDKKKRWKKGDPPRDHYQEVTDNILSAIESGTAPWQRSWDNVPRWPVNALTNKPYHGINVLMLVSQGFQDQRWCSYKSAKAETWQVRAKEQGTKIYFYKPLQRETGKLDHTGQPEVKTIPLLRSYTIFNLSQMDNAPDLDRTTTAERVLTDLTVQISEEIIEASGAEIVHGYRRAGYSPSEDKVYMPDRASFTSDAEYYSVVLHELAHWTGHETRMAREFGTSRDTDEYAREELRAEMASAMIGMRLGLPAAIDGHAAYVEHYMEILRGDKKEVFRAARDAEKIARYVLSFHPEFRDEFEAEHQAQMTAAVSAGAPEDVFDASDFDFEPDFELDSLRP